MNLKEAQDVNFWSDELNLKAEELREIVRHVGPQVHDVKLHLAKNLLSNWPAIY